MGPNYEKHWRQPSTRAFWAAQKAWQKHAGGGSAAPYRPALLRAFVADPALWQGHRAHQCRPYDALRDTRDRSEPLLAARAWHGRGAAVWCAHEAVHGTAHSVQARGAAVRGWGGGGHLDLCINRAVSALQGQRGQHATTGSVRVGRVVSGSEARSRGGGALCGHATLAPAQCAFKLETNTTWAPARAASLCRSTAPSAAWRAHRAPDREPHTAGPRAA